MAKTKGGKSKGFISAGIHSNVATSTRSEMKRAVPQYVREHNKLDAWKKGQNPWITVSNPNKEETNKPFIRVRAEVLYGSPRKMERYCMNSMKSGKAE